MRLVLTIIGVVLIVVFANIAVIAFFKDDYATSAVSLFWAILIGVFMRRGKGEEQVNDGI